MKREILARRLTTTLLLLACAAGVVGCKGGGKGGGGGSIVTGTAVQIGGDWNNSVCTVTAVSGSHCVSRALRTFRNIPFPAKLHVEQSGSTITQFVVELGDEFVGPWSGRIDEGGNVMLQIPEDLLGGPDASEPFVCPETQDAFTVTLHRSVLTGGATESEMTLVLREDYVVSQGGVEVHEIVVEKRIEGAR